MASVEPIIPSLRRKRILSSSLSSHKGSLLVNNVESYDFKKYKNHFFLKSNPVGYLDLFKSFVFSSISLFGVINLTQWVFQCQAKLEKCKDHDISLQSEVIASVICFVFKMICGSIRLNHGLKPRIENFNNLCDLKENVHTQVLANSIEINCQESGYNLNNITTVFKKFSDNLTKENLLKASNCTKVARWSHKITDLILNFSMGLSLTVMFYVVYPLVSEGSSWKGFKNFKDDPNFYILTVASTIGIIFKNWKEDIISVQNGQISKSRGILINDLKTDLIGMCQNYLKRSPNTQSDLKALKEHLKEHNFQDDILKPLETSMSFDF